MKILSVHSNTSLYIDEEHQLSVENEIKNYGYTLRNGIWDIPNGIIGSIATENLIIEINPKIEYLTFLDYFNLLIQNNFKTDIKNFEFDRKNQSQNIAHGLLSSFKLNLVEVIKKGLPKNYLTETQRTNHLIGNIDFAKTYKNMLLEESFPVATNVDKLSYAYEELYAIKFAYEKYKFVTNDRILEFENISRYINTKGYNKQRYLVHKNFSSLSKCYDLAYLINNNFSGTRKGSSHSVSFLINANKVFEDFISKYIKEIFKNENFEVQFNKIVASTEDNNHSLFISPDLIYLNHDLIILDMKNKNYFKKISLADYHQMISYMDAFNAKVAILIYPVIEDRVLEKIFTVLHDKRKRIIRLPINIRNLNPIETKDKLQKYMFY